MSSSEDRKANQVSALPDPKKLYDRSYTSICRFFLRRGFTLEQARDLTQETFLEAMRARQQYRGEASATGWILGIARNVYRKHLRYRNRKKRTAELVPLETWLEHEGLGDSSVGSELPLERSLASERAKLFKHAMSTLSTSQRDCLLLRVDQDLSYREIANVLGISIEAVKARLFQAKKGLRKRLSEHFIDDLY